MARIKNRKRASLAALATAAIVATAIVAAVSTGPAGGAVAAPSQSLAGKKVLIVPYWLDNFFTAWSNWLTRDLKAQGATTTVINANAVASRQLNAINNAINTGQYDAIVWAPIDLGAAVNTVKQIQAAKIPQVVFQGQLDPKVVTVPHVNLDEAHSLTDAGVLAAKYLKAHPKLGTQPLAAFMGVYPQNSICVLRMKSYLTGLRSVTPSAKVVFFGSAKNSADAATKMTDFITQHKKFNVFDGCGSGSTLGGLAALKSAGLAGAVNKVPEHVFIETQDGTPPELENLWNKNSAVMISSLLPARSGAQVTANLLTKVMTGKIAQNSNEQALFGWTPLTPDCKKYRPIVLQQFQGVPGFNVPKCP
jgi:ABC-type sugar transport system substrate-binding protein